MKSLSSYLVASALSLLFIFMQKRESYAQEYKVDFYNAPFIFSLDSTFIINVPSEISENNVLDFYKKIESSHDSMVVNSLLAYKKKYNLNDWIYYQLVRQTAQKISPKQDNYSRYTLYKWYLMCKSGYDARLGLRDNQIIFYIKSNDDISDLPFFHLNSDNYICLNYHDYKLIFNYQETYQIVDVKIPEAKNSFSYKVTRLPDFKPDNYIDKDIGFKYNGKGYHFKLKVNTEVNDIFANYPIVDYETYFNIPLSQETYESIIPFLKRYTAKMPIKKGVDYLMQFTRYAFLYEDDREIHGMEKRFAPEQTLINDMSDCDDRAALFFYLIKEIYDLPMIALRYPTHVTLAVQFEKPIGQSILYNGNYYTLCEPTPQSTKLGIGELSLTHQQQKYEVVYHYEPTLIKK